MQLYTIGNTENYRNAIQEYGKIYKMAGGYVFKSIEDAQKLLKELEHTHDWSIWILGETTEDNIRKANDGWWYYLNIDLDIIRELSDTDKTI